MARALVITACLALGPVGSAMAGGKTSKVTIETDPPGAKVYFNLKEDGEICTTPCTVDAPIGETPIIIEAENRKSVIENLVVPRKTVRPMKVAYKLDPAVGALVVEGGAGATIKIDDADQGKAPRRIEDVQAGAHHVVLERNGKKIYDDFVEIETGRDATVTPTVAVAAEPAGGDEPAIAAVEPPAAPRDRSAPSVSVTLAVDAGFRQFSYKGNTTPRDQRDDREAGQLLVGPIVELWPTRLLGLGLLRGLALYARFELGVNKQDVSVENDAMALRLQTSWRSLEVSVHHRWTIRGAATLEVGGGYTDDRYAFTGDAQDRRIVPDAAYKTVRIGGRASLLVGSLEPYLTFENRIVLSGGALEDRYANGTSTSGVRGSLGAVKRFGKLDVRVEGTLTLYSWTFRPDASDMTAPQATGGRDFIQNVMLAVGYSYY
jgi:hypothetical protein